MLIDIAVPSESNTSAKFREKLSNYQDWEIEVNQGACRSWKTQKVMEFKNFIFQAWKVMEFKLLILEIHGKLKFRLVVQLLQMMRQRGAKLNSANGTYFGGHQRLCLLNYLKSKEYPQTREILKVFESDN